MGKIDWQVLDVKMLKEFKREAFAFFSPSLSFHTSFHMFVKSYVAFLIGDRYELVGRRYDRTEKFR